MRFRIDLARTYLVGCLAFTWALTACVSDITTPSSVPEQGYDVVGSSKGLARGWMSTKLVDGDGKEVFNSTYNLEEYSANLEIAATTHFSMLDSLNLKALSALITGKGQNTHQTGAVAFAFAGHHYTVTINQRGPKGEARNFKIAFGGGDTTLSVNSTDATSGNKSYVLKAGANTLYSGTSILGIANQGGSVDQVPDQENCLGRFAEVVVDLGLAMGAIAHGLYTLDPFEIFCGAIMLVNSMGQMWLWIMEDCYNTFMDWLQEFWISNCLDPLFSWTPFCEE